ncbi:DUF1134 domain-containing protein [Roseospirillum parvum]|uniref:DUF1134 domain-containing protein n=1 Tax=Roseospirillum parvum TaxID=83401 RepID=A0A1G7YH14_9PROT|nr:DUF1134 domain-containing protein [Roseospirillum parvum]SDG95811.1 hypothetical protein SAMN05421742_103304 [Roseospirillum parvum]
MKRFFVVGRAALAVCLLVVLVARPALAEEETFSQNEILEAARGFFGATTEGLAQVVEKVFADHGRPNAYITGEEVSGAIGVGLRYGEGTLNRKGGATRPIYWQGPSVGFDLGGNASRVFTLVYHLGADHELYQRIPGVEGTFYFVGGVGVNYQRSGELVLAPIRTGVGLRAGANIGYLHYSHEHSWIPF